MSRHQRTKETSVTSKTKSWLFLVGAIAAEVTGSLSLKAALDAPGLYVLVATGYIGAFVFLGLVLRSGMSLGVAYGIWAAAGVALTAVMSLLLFGEPLTLLMCVGIVVVIAGVLSVELGAHVGHKEKAPAA